MSGRRLQTDRSRSRSRSPHIHQTAPCHASSSTRKRRYNSLPELQRGRHDDTRPHRNKARNGKLGENAHQSHGRVPVGIQDLDQENSVQYDGRALLSAPSCTATTPMDSPSCGTTGPSSEKRLTDQTSYIVTRSTGLYPTPQESSRCAGDMETDEATLMRRQKNIDYGKADDSYKLYLSAIPKARRSARDPQTPDKFMKYSRRSWDSMVRNWRIMIHRACERLTLPKND